MNRTAAASALALAALASRADIRVVVVVGSVGDIAS